MEQRPLFRRYPNAFSFWKNRIAAENHQRDPRPDASRDVPRAVSSHWTRAVVQRSLKIPNVSSEQFLSSFRFSELSQRI